MIHYTSGNLLNARTDAVVNTVNTVGVMGKGIALMFKERYPENFKAYEAACKAGEVRVGELFITPSGELDGPQWIINFPTKKHWRHPSKLEWVQDGLVALKQFILEKKIHSIAIPPLGCGNGGLEWQVVRPIIKAALDDLEGVDVLIFEPTKQYQNVAKKQGVEKLTIPRALVAEMIRRYELIGFECSLLEVQKIAWFLVKITQRLSLNDLLKLDFEANRYGPYAHRLTHLLNNLDGSYLHCEKRIADAKAEDTIHFDHAKSNRLHAFFNSGEAQSYLPVIEKTDKLIDGFQSPVGMEALATVDWLLTKTNCAPTLVAVKQGISAWPTGQEHARRKIALFNDQLISLVLERLTCVDAIS